MPLEGFLGALTKGDRGEAVIFGVPFDGTASFRSGARFGPASLREASYSLETYSPFIDRDLSGRDYVDWGDIDAIPGNIGRTLEQVERTVQEIVAEDMRPVALGGEHTITLGVVRALAPRFPNLHILQIDAHADFKDEYLGERLSHATVMRRVAELVPPERIHRIGIRSGTREELQLADIALPIANEVAGRVGDTVLNSFANDDPLYITLDLDTFDPSLVPGVSNPEPNGLTWREFIQIVRTVSFKNIVGFDVNELAPHYDPTGVSSVVAASAVRELLLAMMA